MTKDRFCLLVRSLDCGGAERQLVLLARALAERGIPVEVGVFYGGGLLEKELEGAGVRVEAFGKQGRWHILGFFWRLVRWVRNDPPRVIYSWLEGANIVTAVLKWFAPSVRVIWSIRGSMADLRHYDWTRQVCWHAERLLSRIPEAIVSNSRAGLENVVRNGFPPDRVTVVPNGIDTGHFCPDRVARERVRAEWNLPPQARLIGLVARLDPMKDHVTFLRAAALLAASDPEVRFACIGGGSSVRRQELHSLARQLGLENRLIWQNFRADMGEIYNAFDIACSSSAWGEGFCNGIAEAMACGIPCVVTDVGDSAAIVGDTGGVVTPGNPEAFAKAVRRMLESNHTALGARARERVVRCFPVNTMVSRTMDILCTKGRLSI